MQPPPDPTATLEVVLDDGQARDLELALLGLLPDGHLLGAPLPEAARQAVAAGGRPTHQVAVLRPSSVTQAVEALLLRDQEHTPLALVSPLTDAAHLGLPVLVGPATAVRARESSPLPSARLETDRGAAAVLVLARGIVVLDEPSLRGWAAAAPERPLVLVAEGGSSARHLPARVTHALAVETMRRLGRDDAEIRVAPLHLREAASDERLSRALAQGLGSAHTLVLSEGSDGDAPGVWVAASSALVTGRPGPLPGVEPWVEAHLRRWRPPRPERGLVVLFTGLSGSGKSTLARDLDTHLQLRSLRRTTLLDGDVVRRLLSSGLGFDRASREANVRRIGWVAARVAEHGGTAICSPIAPFASTRAEVRAMVEAVADLVLVHVSTPLEECERRDLKGLYARARAGEIPDFTGISSPYEIPEDADVTVDTSTLTKHEALRAVVDHLVDGGWLPEDAR